MSNLSTKYLGLELSNPFIVGASYLTKNADRAKRAEDAGAAAIVLPSLFEEQIEAERKVLINELEEGTNSFGEALSYLPEPKQLDLGPELYLSDLEKIKQAIDVPVIASLNGSSNLGWVEYASVIERAGADAIELNIYFPPAYQLAQGVSPEDRLVNIAKKVVSTVDIPVSVKLSSQFTSVSDVCLRLEKEANVAGVVLFNRFFQPNIDIETLEKNAEINLSTSSDLSLRLAWVGVLAEHMKSSIGLTGGVHEVEDAVKSIMVGADAIQVVSSLINNGVDYIGVLKKGVSEWLYSHDYETLASLKGTLSIKKAQNPEAAQRINYMRFLKSWQNV